MQYSFYGGQQGKNFEIAQVFDNKIQMMQDLMKRYQSSIAIGDLVLISYGMPNEDTPSYRHNADLDIATYGRTYNATLWQKIYTEKDNREIQNVTGTEIEYISKDFGLGYKLIAVLTGNTPIFKVMYEALKANQKPSVTIDNTNIDNPVLTFHLPVSQILALKDTIILNANQNPDVTLDDSDIDHPKIQFSLPQSQQILPKNVKTTPLDADENPEIIFENTGTNPDGSLKVNNPSIEFKLPVSQIIGLGNTDALDADQLPQLSIDESNINRPKLNINLPQSQVLQLNPTIVLAPLEDPDIDYDDTNINRPTITFNLPRAVKFMYGDKLGAREDGTYILNLVDAPEIQGLRPGDYYINEGTGFIYLVTNEDETSRTFVYQACLSAPVPEISTSAVDPYEADGDGFKVKDPTIKKSWSDPVELIGLILGFQLPRLPNLKGEAEFIGPLEEGSVTGKPTSTTEFTYSFKVPSGARFFGGDEVTGETSTVTIDEARPGDWYINGDKTSENNGDIYRLDVKKTWIRVGNIKGNPGDPLNIVGKFDITSNEVPKDTLKDVSEYIEQTLLGGNKPKENEIIAITYEALGDDAQTIAYWYFVVNDRWERVQLTGAVSNLIENFYTESPEDNPVTNKTYSIDYINKLIGGNITPDNADKTTFSKDQLYALFGWGTFEEAEAGDWWPEIGVDKDTLSAEEILNLMSWGSMITIDL